MKYRCDECKQLRPIYAEVASSVGRSEVCRYCFDRFYSDEDQEEELMPADTSVTGSRCDGCGAYTTELYRVDPLSLLVDRFESWLFDAPNDYPTGYLCVNCKYEDYEEDY